MLCVMEMALGLQIQSDYNCTCEYISDYASCIFHMNHSCVADALESLPTTIKVLNLTFNDTWRGMYPFQYKEIELGSIERFYSLETLIIAPPPQIGEPVFERATPLGFGNETFANLPNFTDIRINLPLVDQDLSDVFVNIKSLKTLDLKWVKTISKSNLIKLMRVINKTELVFVNISNFQTIGEQGYSPNLNLTELFDSVQTKIKTLDISWNGLTMLTNGISIVAPNLEYLDISHNLLINNQVSVFLLEVALMNVSDFKSNVQGSQELNPLPRIPNAKYASNSKAYFAAVGKCISNITYGNVSNMVKPYNASSHKLYTQVLSRCFSETHYDFPPTLIPPIEDTIDVECMAFIRLPFFRGNKNIDVAFNYFDIQSHLGITFSGTVCLWPNSSLETLRFAYNENIFASNLLSESLNRMSGIKWGDNLRELDFSGNNLKFNIRNLTSSFVGLVTLNFSNNAIILSDNYSICEKNLKLKTIDLSRNRLISIPHDLVRDCTFLRHLYLWGNRLTKTVFFWIPSLSNKHALHIDLRENEISHLCNDFTKELGRNADEISLDLSNNPFVCECSSDSIYFIKWVYHSQDILKGDQSYECSVDRTTYNLNGQKIQNKMSEVCANNQIWIVIETVITTVSVFLFMLIVFVTYRKRWKIRYFLFMRLDPRKENRNQITKKKFKYDAFVSYSAEDRFWVHGVLMKELESVYAFNLCIHYRDFRVGADILEEINEKMNQSREIVVVLSETSVDKYWCEQELKISLALTNQRRQNLIVIKIGNIAPDVESVTAKHVLQHRNYLEWTDEMDKDQDRQKLFWARLVAFMYGTNIGDTCFSCCKFSSRNLSDSLDGFV